MKVSFNMIEQVHNDNDTVLAVFSSVRGLGLLSCAFGVLTAPQRCSELLDQMLSGQSVLQQQQAGHVLLSAAVGPMRALLKARQGDEAHMPDSHASIEEHGLPASKISDAYEGTGIHRLGVVQQRAAEHRRAHRDAAQEPGLIVRCGVAVSGSGLPPQSHVVSFCAGYKLIERYNTAAVRRRLTRLGGGFERLRAAKAAGRVAEYELKPVACRAEFGEDFDEDDCEDKEDMVDSIVMTSMLFASGAFVG